jgi:hypothetical protein
MNAKAPLIDAAEVEQAPASKPGELTMIRDLAAELYKAERDLAKLLLDVDAKKAEIENLELRRIPAAMQAVGARRFDLEKGFRVEVEDLIKGSILVANRGDAFAWLDDHGHLIVKRVITVSFGKDEDKWAKKFIADMAKRKKPLRAEIKEAIHDGTLQKFVREMVAKERAGELPPDEKLPRELIGVYEAKVARLIDPAEEAKALAARKSKKPKAEAEDGVEM